MRRAIGASLLALAYPLLAGFAPVPLPDATQVAGKRLPDVRFEDDAQQPRQLSSLRGQPLVVIPTYTSCHGACPLIAAGVKKALLASDLDPRSFQVFLFSFDEHTTAADLTAFRRAQKLPASWILARLDRPAIRALIDALDYRISRVEGEWAHPNAIAFISPDLNIATFLHGVSFRGSQIRRAIEVAEGATDWSTRAAPWSLAVGTMGLTLSLVVLVHALRSRRKFA